MIAFFCSACGQKLSVKDEFAGKPATCPHCKQRVIVPAVIAVSASPAAAGQRNVIPPAPPERLEETRAPNLSQMETATAEAPFALPTVFDFLAPPEGPGEIGRLGGYRILKLLGQGGMGMVFKAEDISLKRSIALKVMKPDQAKIPAAHQRFIREAQSMAALKHDHIVTVYQVAEDRGVPFIAMEYLQGEPLAGWLKKNKPTITQSLRLGREIAQGLAAAHERGLIHRDIKPGNIWLEAPKGRVKILDFGLAQVSKVETRLTQSGVVLGTPAFMSPEQARADNVDARTDLFSLGCVLYLFSTGAMPFQGDSLVSLMTALFTVEPKPPHEVNPEVPPALSALVMKLLAKSPEDRPASAKAVVEAILALEKAKTAPAQAPAVEKAKVAATLAEKPAQNPNFAATLVEKPAQNPNFAATLVEKPAQNPNFAATLVEMPQGSGVGGNKVEHASQSKATSPAAASRRRSRVAALVAVLLCGTGLLGWGVTKFMSGPQIEGGKQSNFDAAWPTASGKPFTNSLGMKLVGIPPGEFKMGSPHDEGSADEKPRHLVRITKPFYLGTHEVTLGQFREFVRDTGYQTEAEKDGIGGGGYDGVFSHPEKRFSWRDAGFEQTDEHPVVNVSWNDAKAFCDWLSKKEGKTYRLPTEAEWEYACRAGTTTRFYSGDDVEGLMKVANIADASLIKKLPEYKLGKYWDDGYPFTSPVGCFQPNAFGLYDMHGNVEEWCQDVYQADYYKKSPAVDPGGPGIADTSSKKVSRGGDWYYGHKYCSSTYRDSCPSNYRNAYLGFRVAADPSER